MRDSVLQFFVFGSQLLHFCIVVVGLILLILLGRLGLVLLLWIGGGRIGLERRDKGIRETLPDGNKLIIKFHLDLFDRFRIDRLSGLRLYFGDLGLQGRYLVSLLAHRLFRVDLDRVYVV